MREGKNKRRKQEEMGKMREKDNKMKRTGQGGKEIRTGETESKV